MRMGVYWHVFPTFAEAKDAIWRDPHMLFTILPEQLIEKTNESELVVYFKNGSVLKLQGADEPDRLRGAGIMGCVLDEFGTMKFEAWQIIEPILRANGGWAWFVGTPKGRNHLYDYYIRGQRESDTWKSWLLTGDKSGLFDDIQLAEMKQSMTQSMYSQEIMCSFLENEGVVFRGVRQAMKSQPEAPKQNHVYVLGVDLAKVTDYTVVTVYDRAENNQVYQARWQTLEWPFQRAKILEIAKYYNNALTIVDATGVGDPIADDLIRAGVAVEAFKITEQTKKELIEKLSIWIEQKKCKLLPMEETLLEFDNFSYEIGPTGKVRYMAREGYHDDIPISHSLAIHALQPLIINKILPEMTPVQKAYLQAKDQYRRSIYEDGQWDSE